MKLKSNDPLNALLRQALYEKKVSVKLQPMKLTGHDPHDLYQSSAWKPGRLLVLIYVDSSGVKSLLGLFQEMLNQRAKARRLVRPDKETCAKTMNLSALPREEVTGDHWLKVQRRTPRQESPDEVRALRARFTELLATYD